MPGYHSWIGIRLLIQSSPTGGNLFAAVKYFDLPYLNFISKFCIKCKKKNNNPTKHICQLSRRIFPWYRIMFSPWFSEIYSAIHQSAGFTAHGRFRNPFRFYPFSNYTAVPSRMHIRIRNHQTFDAKRPSGSVTAVPNALPSQTAQISRAISIFASTRWRSVTIFRCEMKSHAKSQMRNLVM